MARKRKECKLSEALFLAKESQVKATEKVIAVVSTGKSLNAIEKLTMRANGNTL